MAARSPSCSRLQTSLLRAVCGSRVIAAPKISASAIRRTFHAGLPRNCENAFKEALESNKAWAAKTKQSDADFFTTLAKGQAPPILWLGCADSRVPETTILGQKPGHVFTHRNIANIINPTDISMLSIVQYAVAHVKVKHIVLCGHTSCGGIVASLANTKLDVLDVWLQPLRALREEHAAELEKLDDKAKSDHLARANVQHGVSMLKRIPAVIDAQRDSGLQVHGVVFNLASGELESVDTDESEHVGTKRVAAFERK